MNKRDFVKKVMNLEETDRVPMGFWWHFTGGEDLAIGYQKEEHVKNLIAAHKEMIEGLNPDMVKMMSDGFFVHPEIIENQVDSVEKLSKIKHITKDHPWVQRQIELIKGITDITNGEIFTLYTIFSAPQQLRLFTEYFSPDRDSFRKLMVEHTEETMNALKIVEDDTLMLLDEIKKETDIDGIFYSVQMIQDEKADEDYHNKWIVPSDLKLLDRINEHWEYNMLHICGYEHYHNNVGFYKKYPCKSYNWATHTDNITMKEGKEIFGKCVCGGFDNNANTLIDTGSIEELKEYTKNIIEDAGKKGLIIGADCTIPGNVPYERLNAIREVGKL